MASPVTDDKVSPHVSDGQADIASTKGEIEETHDVFRQTEDGVQFRTVSWQRATIIFCKIQFAMSILSVPGAFATLGAVPGAVSLVGWHALNTSLADMCGRLWSRPGRELVGLQILIAQVLISAAGIVSISTAFNAVSFHGTCTVVFTLLGAILITAFSSVRTFSKLGWLTWLGFTTFFVAVFVFVVAVTKQDRPAVAPQTGPFELGWTAVAHPTFVAGITASANIFISNSGSSMYLPVISEMRRPQDYRRAALVTGGLVLAMYLSFSLVIYRWCGVWLATPAFGSAGPLFKKISYGIALPGLIIGVGIYQHVAAKYIFVRVLRDSHHLQENTVVHWSTWIGSNLVLGILAFIVAEAVPILNYLLGLAGAICFAPFSLVFPALLWMQDFSSYKSGSIKQKGAYGFHILIVLVGLFMVIAGTHVPEGLDGALVALLDEEAALLRRGESNIDINVRLPVVRNRKLKRHVVRAGEAVDRDERVLDDDVVLDLERGERADERAGGDVADVEARELGAAEVDGEAGVELAD
ncbi:N amino acid transport system protein [Colletotrichum gloeosporioides]|uniref:N amino acid transport system protein n=1 Tax=Colletotrichum gloeosporioides TaxID=474922 RepID=A0A8H4FP12_COLGL|nr:N amino acid transport system protein [Colletotrichum gloeosporioides]KAF3809313.1 N amino acid transport system protein [Colletotrichum gloeosporioides]